MTKNEMELIDIIRSSEDQQNAVMTAIDIICQYLKQHAPSQSQSPADSPESFGTNQA